MHPNKEKTNKKTPKLGVFYFIDKLIDLLQIQITIFHPPHSPQSYHNATINFKLPSESATPAKQTKIPHQLRHFCLSLDRVQFPGGTAEKFPLKLGSGQFVPGFEDQVIGIKEGEERDINITFPEQYVPDLAGKAVVFKVKLIDIVEK